MSKVKRLQAEHDGRIQAIAERQQELDTQLRSINTELRETRNPADQRLLREKKFDIECALNRSQDEIRAATHAKRQELESWGHLDARFTEELSQAALHLAPDPRGQRIPRRPLHEIVNWLKGQAAKLEREQELEALLADLPAGADQAPQPPEGTQSFPAAASLR